MIATPSFAIAADCAAAPIPYEANYSIMCKGKLAGSMQVVLERKSSDTFSYRMDTRVRWGIVRPRIQQQSDFSWKNGVVLPGDYQSTQKITFYKRSELVNFNWQTMMAAGKKKRADFELEIETGMQDKLTIYLLLARTLCQGERSLDAVVVSGPVLKLYHYRFQSLETLRTGLGDLKTTHLRHGTADSEKQTDLWLAEQTRFLPVKLVYRNKSDVVTMKLIDMVFATGQ